MDVFKLAFETTIVGLLTFGWLGVATHLLFPDFQFDSIRQKFPDFAKNNPTAIGVGLLILAYCLGSAILPIANQLVNDEHWPLPENAIRCLVFKQQQKRFGEIRKEFKSLDSAALPKERGLLPDRLEAVEPLHCSSWGQAFDKDHIGVLGILRVLVGFPEALDQADESHKDEILTFFEQEESTVLNQPSDKTEQLRQLRERIVVLRGAVFSGLVLLLICLFAFFAGVPGYPSNWKRPRCGYLLAGWFTAFALINGVRDLLNQNIFDIPVLESVMLVITIFGFNVVRRGVNAPLFRTKRCALIALFFTGLTYGGWMWSEVIYDKQVISTFAVLQSDAEAQKAVSASRP
jgi:hypothetical protein